MTKYLQMLDKVWARSPAKMDWLGMEDVLVQIMRDESLIASEKVKLSKECIDAYTRRGHFPELWDARGNRI